MRPLYDAHNHLQDERLAPALDEIISQAQAAGIERCVVNGTCEDDWPKVAELAEKHPDFVQPAFGLHPWRVVERSSHWLQDLTDYLDRFETATLGECGLDRWIKNSDFDAQWDVFTTQLSLAATRNLPLSVHCLQAWGALLDILRTQPRPERGFLMHSYGGAADLVAELANLGAYFSFSGAFLEPRKDKARAAFRRVPPDRILIETDAPDMLPPPSNRVLELSDAEGRPLNHPANLPSIFSGLAQVLEIDQAALGTTLAQNFRTFFDI